MKNVSGAYRDKMQRKIESGRERERERSAGAESGWVETATDEKCLGGLQRKDAERDRKREREREKSRRERKWGGGDGVSGRESEGEGERERDRERERGRERAQGGYTWVETARDEKCLGGLERQDAAKGSYSGCRWQQP